MRYLLLLLLLSQEGKGGGQLESVLFLPVLERVGLVVTVVLLFLFECFFSGGVTRLLYE